MADIELVIKIPEELYTHLRNGGNIGASLLIENVIKNGTPFRGMCGKENSEIKNEVKDLSKRVETLEKQIKEDREEQLKKLRTELEYAKFRCTL